MTERTNILNETQDDVTRIVYLPMDKLRAFAEHPYKIIDNDEMASLVESINARSPHANRRATDGERRVRNRVGTPPSFCLQQARNF